MSEIAGIRKWKALYRSLDAREQPHLKPLPKPTDAMLDEFESRSGFTLPLSYRAFIKVFGPGELAWEYRMFAPGYPHQSEMIDLEKFNADFRKPFADTEHPRITKRLLEQYKDGQRLFRAVVFCRTGTGDLICWDPADVRDGRQREYGIYQLARKDFVEPLAVTFPEFIEDVCLSEANLHPRHWDDKEFGTRRAFFPEYDTTDLDGQ